MYLKKILSFFFFSSISLAQAQQNDNVLESLLKSREDLFGKILQNKDKYEIQIIYTQIDRDAKNRPSFTSYSYNVDKDRYFYPASTIKLPIALLALEKLNKLKIKGLNKNTPLTIGKARSPQTEVLGDSTSKDSLATIAHYVKKLFIVSDNDAYNRLFEFLGQGYINWVLEKKGYTDFQILQRVAAPDFDAESNRYTNPFRFFKGKTTIYQQPEIFNKVAYSCKIKQALKGRGHISQDKLVNKPFDFSYKNMMSLQTLQDILKATLFPQAVKPEKRFNLTPDDYRLVYRSMSILPRESKVPVYNTKEYPDGFVKFMLLGDTEDKMPENIRIFNKVGTAYGYMIENGYFVDFESKSEFMLSAVIYVNENQILNDGKYEYKEIGLPFLASLGRVIAWYEKNRPKKHLPNLQNFKMDYKE